MKKSSFLFDILETFVIGIGFFVIVYSFIASPHVIIGTSMDDSFANGEFLFADKVSYRMHNPERGDVIIFKFSESADYIKRIIGLPGDKIMLHDGFVYLNGTKMIETAYIKNGAYTFGMSFLSNDKTITVPKGEYFVLGDNREESSDSRQWGYVSRDVIEGKAWCIYWPLNKVGGVTPVTYKNEIDQIVGVKGS